MRLYDFDECVLLDNKGKNTVKVEPTEISIGYDMCSATEIEIRGIVRDDDWRPNNFHFEPARRKGRKVDYSKLYLSIFGDMPKIKDVIFNDPATIVFWADRTKTVVQCQDGDIFDPEKGLAMAISKKALGNKGNYSNELKKWLPKDKDVTLEYTLNTSVTSTSINDMGQSIVDAVNKMMNQLERGPVNER